MVVVEEHRTSSKSTDSRGSHTSEVIKMEATQGLLNDKGIENCGTEQNETVLDELNDLGVAGTCSDSENNESLGQCISLTSVEDNCAPGLMSYKYEAADIKISEIIESSNNDSGVAKDSTGNDQSDISSVDNGHVSHSENNLAANSSTSVHCDYISVNEHGSNNLNEEIVVSAVVHEEPSKSQDDNVNTNGTNAHEDKIDKFQEELDKEHYDEISDFIPKTFWEMDLKCLSYPTIQELSWRLDVLEEIGCGHLPKDFTGLCQRIRLDNAFIKYLVKSQIRLKTYEVFSMWEVHPKGHGPRPTVGNFCKIVYFDLNRPDVITDLHENIVRDASNWEKTRSEALTKRPDEEDLSWQLTRHDVATGKKTFYTSCLCYADEDEGMAALITNFFQIVCKGTRFFRPQFDLKMGKYVCDTTAKVIEERCNGKVIFLLSDYFYASEVCQFAVNFAHQKDPTAEQGNLIPFYLTNKYEMAPKVLKGIAGVRWGRNQFRYHSWSQLTDCLLSAEGRRDSSEDVNQSQLPEIQERIKIELESNKSAWLCDPPYDADTPSPGPALPLNEPPDDPTNSSSYPFDPDVEDDEPIVDPSREKKSRSMIRRIRSPVVWIINKFSNSRRRRAPMRNRVELNEGFTDESRSSSIV